MTGNPKGSKWRSTPNAARKRKRLEITLSPEALKRLEQIAAIRGVSKSEVVETMLFGGSIQPHPYTDTPTPAGWLQEEPLFGPRCKCPHFAGEKFKHGPFCPMRSR